MAIYVPEIPSTNIYHCWLGAFQIIRSIQLDYGDLHIGIITFDPIGDMTLIVLEPFQASSLFVDSFDTSDIIQWIK